MDNAGQSKGGRLAIDYPLLPNNWHNFELLLQASAAYYDSDYEPLEPPHQNNLWVFAVTPVVRYHFTPDGTINPFFEFGSGPGYLSTIYYENRNLGLHFTFQNMLGAGASFGQGHQWSAELQILHYSNAGISTHNRGFTSPVFLSIGYQL